jgi:ribonuclease PH
VSYELGYQEWANGSVLFSMGKTRVLCAATVSEDTPRWLRGMGRGWVTGEYSMLPASTLERSGREVNRGRPGGRTQEIQRLIGRALRSVTDLERLGERTVTVDCDVLVADAGTRTASITGGYIALALALRSLTDGPAPAEVLKDSVAAVSVGIVDGEPRLDLCYEEDAGAEVDCNVVMTGGGALVEVQGTAEGSPFSRPQLDAKRRRHLERSNQGHPASASVLLLPRSIWGCPAVRRTTHTKQPHAGLSTNLLFHLPRPLASHPTMNMQDIERTANRRW